MSSSRLSAAREQRLTERRAEGIARLGADTASSLRAGIAALQADVDTLTTNLATLQTTADSIETKVDTIIASGHA